MKKIFSIIGATLLLASCTEDFTDWASPQKNDPEASKVVTVTATAASDIDLANADETVQMVVPSVTSEAEAATTYQLDLYATPFVPGESECVTLNPDEKGFVAADELQKAVVSLYGARPEARQLGMVLTCLSTVGGQTFKTVIEHLTINVTPRAPKISQNYYIVGGALDWAESAASKAQKFSHSDQDVYDDPVFTITIPSGGAETWFAIGDDEALDAIVAGDWSKLFGTTGASEDLTGSLEYRYNLGADQSLHVAQECDFIKVTINMMDRTYEITPVVLAAQYYMVGGLQGWSDSQKTCLFTPGEKNILSYTTKWTGAWDLKVWDANNFGNWDAAWGSVVDGDNSPSGALINSNAQAISAPSAEFYTFTIDMNTQTYTWTKLDNQNPTEYQNISLIGEFNGWGGDFELTQVTPHNWYAVFTQETDGQLKFRANHDWGVNWGYGNDKDWNVSESFNKIGTNGGGNIFVPAGTYAVYLNDITNSMLILAQ